MGLRRTDLELLMEAFESSAWSEMVVTIDGTRLELTRTGNPPAAAAAASAGIGSPPAAPAPPASAPQPPAAAAQPPAAAPASVGDHEIRAPSVGIFYRAPAPGAPPFVEEGARVAPDDIVCIVEVMKLMNHVRAEVGGVVRSVHVDDATMVEHGRLLFTIDTAS
jgi:acetyl-CoA carboxylase biotin carboxyl carrier protein